MLTPEGRKIYTIVAALCLQRIVNSPKLITLWWEFNNPYPYYHFTVFVVSLARNRSVVVVFVTKARYTELKYEYRFSRCSNRLITCL